MNKPPLIVLVHGAFENASVWSHTIAEFERQHLPSLAVNLGGRDGDETPMQQVSLNLYRDAVLAILEKVDEPVILVGHSFGGMTISAVAEAAPDKIANLVFLAAYLPASGDSLQSLAMKDRDSRMGPNFQVDGENLIATVKEDARVELFAHDGSPELQAVFASSIVAEPLIPIGTPVTLSPENFGRVRKTYIKTTLDRVVSPYLQDLMLRATPVDEVLEISSGHAPFLTRPVELASLIAKLAKS